MTDETVSPRQAWSLNGEHIDLDPIDCASGVPYIALRVRGVRGGRMADLYLNPGHVEQLEDALADAKVALKERTMTHVPRTTEIRLPADMTAEALLFPEPPVESECGNLREWVYAPNFDRLLAEARAEGEAAKTAEIVAWLRDNWHGIWPGPQVVDAADLLAHFNPEAE